MGDMPDYHMYVVPVSVAIPPGQTGISDIGEYDLTPEDLPDGSRGPLLLDIKGRLYVVLYNSTATVEQTDQTKLKATVYQAEKDRTVDHTKVKGVVLKDPTIASSLPTSIENPAIAYDAVLDLFKCALHYNGTKIDPRSIRALTSTDVVTVVQPTAANLKATVTQAEKDRTITGNVTVIQGTPANLKAEVSQPTAASLKATVTQAEKDRTVTGTVTAEQAIAANLKATVTQAEKDRTVTGTVTAQQATRTNLKTQAEREDLTIKYFSNTFTAAGDYAILSAVSDQKHKIYAVNYESNANVEVGLRDGTSTTFRYAVRTTSGVFVQTWLHPIVHSVYTALNLRAEGAVTVKGYVQYKTEA